MEPSPNPEYRVEKTPPEGEVYDVMGGGGPLGDQDP